jgi:rhamnosyltransferase subunit B
VAQGLAAGVPQLVMAMSHDQPDNGHRITRFGVGAYLYPRGFTPRRVATMLAHLTSSPDVEDACRRYRTQIENQMSAEAVFRLLEEAHREACA